MKLSNYLVLLVALVFLGGMTGCGKGNSSGGDTSSNNNSSSNSNTVTSGSNGYVSCQAYSIDCINQMITKTNEGRFSSTANGKRYFYISISSSLGSTSSSSFQYYGTCYKIFKKWGWCDDDNYDYDIGSSFDFERKVISSTQVERGTGDETSLSTNLVTLKTQLVSLLNNAKSLTVNSGTQTVWTGYGYMTGYRDYHFVQQSNTRFLIRTRSSSSSYKDYIIDLAYPLAANPIYYFDSSTKKGYTMAGESF